MTRVEQLADNVTLYLGDCRDVLPTLGKVDVIVTDPVWPNCPPGLLPGHDDPDGLFESFCAVLPPIRQLVVCIRNDCDPRFLRHVPAWLKFQQVAWCQYALPGYLGRVLGGNETAYVFGTPVIRQEGRIVVPSVSPKAQPADRPPNGHPCSRALIHQEWLVHWFSDEGETVLDPFMGSGTAGVAAVRFGRGFIGCEIEPSYFDIACRRISEALAHPDLFMRARDKSDRQIEMF